MKGRSICINGGVGFFHLLAIANAYVACITNI